MAKNTLELKFEAKDINVEEVIGKITKNFDKITSASKNLMRPFNQKGGFTRGLKALSADIEAGNKPAEELQGQFDTLSDKLVPVNDKIKQMQEGLAAIKNAILQVQATDSSNDNLGKFTEQYNLQSTAISALSKQYNKQQTKLKQVKKDLQDYTKEQKKNTEAVDKNSEKVKEQAASLYQLNAAMTLAKQSMKAIYGILTSTSDAYARNALSMKAYELTFSNLGDSAESITNELNSMVDALEKFGYNRSDIQQMAVDFYSLATAVGVSKTAAANMTSDYLKMANRISIATGETLDNVTQMISAAITTGRATGVLTGFAIDLRDESIKKLAVERGLIQAENEDLSQSEMYMLRQYALTDAILKNQNLLNNSGNQYLISQQKITSQIATLKENIGELVEGPITAVMAAINGIISGINSVIATINKTPVIKTIVSVVGAIAIGMFSVFAGVVLVRAGLEKVKTVLNKVLPQTMGWQTTMWGVAKAAGAIIGILSSVALIYTGISGLTSSTTEETTDKIEEQEDQINDNTKAVKKLKNELMGFDEINLLSKNNESTFNLEDFEEQYKKLQEEFDTSAVDDLTKSFEEMSKAGNIASIVLGTITLVTQGLMIATKLFNKEKAKQTGLTVANTLAQGKDTVATGANTVATRLNTKAQHANNTARMIGKALIGGLAVVGAIATIGAAVGALQWQQKDLTASANGNYFPSASATIIGEKYPEVAIPLGNSPQYADMQETIANRTAERLSEMSGFNGTVNVYIGNEQIRDFAVQAVNDDLRVNYGTNLGKLARS